MYIIRLHRHITTLGQVRGYIHIICIIEFSSLFLRKMLVHTTVGSKKGMLNNHSRDSFYCSTKSLYYKILFTVTIKETFDYFYFNLSYGIIELKSFYIIQFFWLRYQLKKWLCQLVSMLVS